MTNFERVLEEINDFGIYQKLRYLMICLAALIPPIVTYMHSFIAPNPSHRCQHPDFNNDSFLVSPNYYKNLSDITLGKCEYKDLNNITSECEKWVFDRQYYKLTLTEEWSMVCDKAIWRNNLQTVYFAGYLVGSIVMGILADHFGRRPIMLSSFIMIIVGGVGVAFGPQHTFGTLTSYIIYAISRFIIACGTRGINVTGFVLGMEIMGPAKRTFAGIVIEYFFAIGQLILVAIAYLNNVVLENDWRWLAILLILPCVPFLGYFWMLPESPRWLLSKNRQTDALEIIKKVAKANKRQLNIETWNGLIEKQNNERTEKRETIINLIKSPMLSVMSAILFLNWMINNFLFYGLGLKSSELGVNPYLSFTISALVEILAYVVIHLILDKLGRKLPYVIFLLGAGLSCFGVTFFPSKIAVVTLAMVGKFCASASYAIIYLYSSELFPTSTRNTGMGACSMMARVGAMVAPLINGLGDLYSPHLPFYIFGISGVIGSASAIILPETLNRSLPENIQQAEKVNRFGFSCRQYEEEEVEEKELQPLKNENRA